MKSLIAFLLLTFAVFAQTTTDNAAISKPGGGYFIQYNIAVDSGETIYSQVLSFRDNDAFSYVTYPWHYGYDLAVKDSINVSAYLLCSFDNSNWIAADTLFTATTATATKGTANLNNVKAPFWKVKIVNNDKSKANTLKLGIYQPVKD